MAEDGRLTRFGTAVLKLMAGRGIMGWSALSKRLETAGHAYSSQRISNWVYGRHAVDHRFPVALRDVLVLDRGESEMLAEAFTYGQREYEDGGYLVAS